MFPLDYGHCDVHLAVTDLCVQAPISPNALLFTSLAGLSTPWQEKQTHYVQKQDGHY